MPPSTNDIRLVVIAEVQKALKELREFREETQDLNKVGSRVDRGFTAAGKAMRFFASALAIRETADMAIEAAKLADNARDLRSTLNRLAAKEGADSIKLMKDLREATAGTVSEVDLMKKATLGKFLGIDLKNIPTLLEFARLRARETGEDVNFLVDSIVRGIGRKSILILDNLGLSMNDLRRETEAMLREQNRWTGELSESVVQLNFQEAAIRAARKGIEESTVSTGKSADQLARLNAEWQNLQVILGILFTGPVADGLEFINELFEKLGLNIDVALAEGLEKGLVTAEQDLKEVNEQLAEVNKQLKDIGDAPAAAAGDFLPPVLGDLLGETPAQAKLRLENRRKTLEQDKEIFEDYIKDIREIIARDAPDPEIPRTEIDPAEVARQKQIADLIAKLRLEAAVRGARNEFEARRIEIDAQFEREKALLAGHQEGLEQLELTHQERLADLRQDIAERQTKLLQEQQERELELKLEAQRKSLRILEEEFERHRQLNRELLSELEQPLTRFISGMLDSASTARQVWNQLFSDLKASITRFLASQAVKGLLNFVANAFLPGAGNLFGGIIGNIFFKGAQHGEHIPGSRSGQVRIVGENNTEEVIIPTRRFWDFVTGQFNLPDGFNISRIPAPQLPAPTNNTHTRVERHNTSSEKVVRVLLESIAPDQNRVVEYFVDVNRNILIPDNRFVDEFLTTKQSEFEQ